MRAVIQRVTKANVQVANNNVGAISKGLLVLIGIEDADNEADIIWLSNKIVSMRLFDDEDGVANVSVKDIGGQLLVISQFTLQAQTKKGSRPSYIKAAKGPVAQPLYNQLLTRLEQDLGQPVASGIFGANMLVMLVNDGPITIIIDSKNKDF